MRRTVRADKSRAIDGKAHRQFLDRHIVHDLIVGALQERRINRREGLVALRGQSGSKGHAMLLGDADIEGAVGEFLAKEIQAGTSGHRGSNGDNLRVLAGLGDQRVGKHLGVSGCIRLRFHLRASDNVELVDAVILVGGILGRWITFAFLGDDMHQDRSLLGVAHVLEHWQQHVEIMAVDGSEIEEAEFLEQRTACPVRPRVFLGTRREAFPLLGQLARQLLADFAQVQIGVRRRDARQITRQRADWRRNRHIVVVEDDDQALVAGAGIVHGLIGHAGAHGAVADNSDYVIGAAVEIARHGHTKARRNRRR